MSSVKQADHPDGPGNRVIVECRRGRWICQDVIVDDRYAINTEAVAMRLDDEPSASPTSQTVVNSSADQPRTIPAIIVEEEQNLTLPTDNLRSELEPPVSLDSNTNASPRKTKSRATRTDHREDMEPTLSGGENGQQGSQLSRSDWTLVVVMLCIVLLPSILSWGPAGGGLNIVRLFWKMVFQGLAVGFSIILILMGLQVQFSSYRLRQWVAHVFQLELREENESPREIRPLKQQLSLEPATGTGDKRATASAAREQRQPVIQKPADHSENPADSIISAVNVQNSKSSERRGHATNQNDETARSSTERCFKVANERDEKACSNREHCPHAANQKDERARDRTDRFVQTTNQERRYRSAMKKMYRKFLLIRRKYKAEMSTLKRTDHEASQVLSRVQLALPILEREKHALLAEVEAIQKQHQEEKRRNQDLLARLHRLNQQFTRIGTPQSAVHSFLQQQQHDHQQHQQQV